MNNIKLTKINQIQSPGIVSGDYSSQINQYEIEAVFDFQGLEKTVRVNVDMKYEEIDFNNPASINESMLKEAYDKVYVTYATYLIDDEKITGTIDVDMKVTTPEGEEFNVKNDNVDQLYDILSMMPVSQRGLLCKEILKNKI